MEESFEEEIIAEGFVPLGFEEPSNTMESEVIWRNSLTAPIVTNSELLLASCAEFVEKN
jgi:hypothetical protein